MAGGGDESSWTTSSDSSRSGRPCGEGEDEFAVNVVEFLPALPIFRILDTAQQAGAGREMVAIGIHHQADHEKFNGRRECSFKNFSIVERFGNLGV